MLPEVSPCTGILPALAAVNRETNTKAMSALVATDGAFNVATDGRGGSLHSSLFGVYKSIALIKSASL